jgi:hypothetical protein
MLWVGLSIVAGLDTTADVSRTLFLWVESEQAKAGHEYKIPMGWNGLIREKPASNVTCGSELSPDPSQNRSE